MAALEKYLGAEVVSALKGKVNQAVAVLEEKVATDLQSYYTKTETNALVGAIPKFAIEPVDTLPTTDISTTTVYLLKSGDETGNLYTEYIYVNGKWEELGAQTVDLTGYYTKTDADSTFIKQSAIAQTLGTSTTAVMSQKAVNDTVGNIQAILETI